MTIEWQAEFRLVTGTDGQPIRCQNCGARTPVCCFDTPKFKMWLCRFCAEYELLIPQIEDKLCQ